MKSGIYKIKNNDNGHIYIGSAVNIESRFRTHLSKLRNNKHHSLYLQRAWNKYGENNFTFEIIENCSVEDLLIREQYYFNELNPHYNICKIAGNTLGIKHSKESNQKKSEYQRENRKRGKENPTSKTIYQYSLNGRFIKEWGGAAEIQRELNIDQANIRTSIKKNITAYGFFWSYENKGMYYKDVPKKGNREKTKKPILQLNINNELIRVWDSAKSATTYLKKREGSLVKCLKGKSKTAYNFIWKYKE